jgi:hypothetical protein
VTTTKSPRRVLLTAYEATRGALPAYSHLYSPRKYTQHQLVPCLVLKEFLRTDYRGLAAHLADQPDLARAIDLHEIPHFTTFQKAAARLLKAAPARWLHDAVLDRARRAGVLKRRVRLAAVDGTGMESRHVSRYYVKRRSNTGSSTQETTYSKYPKVVLVIDCTSHLILSAVPGRGPGSDLRQFRAAWHAAVRRARIGTLLADADFDGEWVHEHVRSFGVRTIIPAERGRPSARPPAGRWRRRMKRRLDKAKYEQRWQIKTCQADRTPSDRWRGTPGAGYDRRRRAAGTGRVVPATPERTTRRDNMLTTPRTIAPPAPDDHPRPGGGDHADDLGPPADRPAAAAPRPARPAPRQAPGGHAKRGGRS